MRQGPTTGSTDSDRVRMTAARVLLAVASIAFLATTSVGTSASTTSTGVVDLRAGEQVVLPMRIAIGPSNPNDPPTSSLYVGMKSVDGVHDVDAGVNVTVRDETGSPIPGDAERSWWTRIDLSESCVSGCALDYSLIFTTTEAGAARQIGRFAAKLGIQYQGSAGPASLELSIDGSSVGVTGQWLGAVAAAVGLLAGIVIAGRFSWSTGRHRFVPGAVLAGLLALAAGRAVLLGPAPDVPRLWDVVPLVGLALGVAWAVTRGTDGDWSWLGVAGWAIVVIGGLLYLGDVGLLPTYRPLELVVISLVGWALIGIVIAQSRAARDPTARLRPLWTTLAVVSQAIILVGLTGVGLSVVEQPFGLSSLSVWSVGLAVPALVFVPIVLWGLRRWLAGKGALLGFVNAVLFFIGLVGVSGLWMMAGLGSTGVGGDQLSTLGPAAAVGLGACVVGFIAAFKAPAQSPAVTAPAIPASDAPPSPEPASAGLPTASA